MNEPSVHISTIRSDLLQYWSERNYMSYDLCDIDNLRITLFLKRRFPNRLVRRIVSEISGSIRKHVPLVTRQIGGVKRQRFSQSDSFFLRALLRSEELGDETMTEIKRLRSRILDDYQVRGDGGGWGQPYDWYSKQLIPKHTIRATVTSQVIKAFVELHIVFQDQVALDYAIKAAQFLCTDFPVCYESEDELCLAYTEIDNLLVYNSNMMIAGSLAMLSSVSDIPEFRSVASRLVRYTCNRQQSDGSWTYFSDSASPPKIDTYHTAYILENLKICEKYLGDQYCWHNSAERGHNFYLDSLFHPDGRPKLSLTRPDVLDSHVIAQCMIVAKYFGNEGKFNSLLYDYVPLLYNPEGYLYFRRNGRNIEKTPYVRWGDSWMAFALAMEDKVYIC